MKKIELNVTEEELKILKNEMKKNPNEKVRNKSKVIYFRVQGCTEKELMQKTDLALDTILNYIKNFKKHGLTSIYTTGYKGQPSRLDPYAEQILADFKSNPPSTIDEAKTRIFESYGVKIQNTALRNFLKKKDFHTKKQEAFQQKQIKNNNRNF